MTLASYAQVRLVIIELLRVGVQGPLAPQMCAHLQYHVFVSLMYCDISSGTEGFSLPLFAQFQKPSKAYGSKPIASTILSLAVGHLKGIIAFLQCDTFKVQPSVSSP